MKRFWLFAPCSSKYSPPRHAQSLAANNTLPTSESQCISGSTRIDFDRLFARAQKGDADAQFWSGAAFEQGWCGTPDLKEALKWYKLSAAQHNADAENGLGKLYEDGRGAKQHYLLAAAWYRKAAEHVPDLGGAGQGRNNLGLLYMQGLRVPQDIVLAYMWFRIAGSGADLSDAQRKMTRKQVLDAEQLAKD